MKGPSLSAGELLDLAIQMERRGATFYKACAKASLGPPIVLVFEHLKAAEQDHARIFAKMKKTLTEEALGETDSTSARGFIEKLIGDRIAPETERVLNIVPELFDPVDAVEFAIELERKSILLYSAMNQLVHLTEKEVIERIISEEHNHVRSLVDLLNELET
jgi:rubrerythrin